MYSVICEDINEETCFKKVWFKRAVETLSNIKVTKESNLYCRNN